MSKKPIFSGDEVVEEIPVEFKEVTEEDGTKSFYVYGDFLQKDMPTLNDNVYTEEFIIDFVNQINVDDAIKPIPITTQTEHFPVSRVLETVGKPVSAEYKKDTGVASFKGKIFDTSIGKDVQILIREGVLRKFSIRYFPVISEEMDDGKILRKKGAASGIDFAFNPGYTGANLTKFAFEEQLGESIRVWKKSEAIKWLKEHGFKTGNYEEMTNYHSFRQTDPEKYDSFRTDREPFNFKPSDGVMVIYGIYVKEGKRTSEIQSIRFYRGDKQEEILDKEGNNMPEKTDVQVEDTKLQEALDIANLRIKELEEQLESKTNEYDVLESKYNALDAEIGVFVDSIIEEKKKPDFGDIAKSEKISSRVMEEISALKFEKEEDKDIKACVEDFEAKVKLIVDKYKDIYEEALSLAKAEAKVEAESKAADVEKKEEKKVEEKKEEKKVEEKKEETEEKEDEEKGKIEQMKSYDSIHEEYIDKRIADYISRQGSL